MIEANLFDESHGHMRAIYNIRHALNHLESSGIDGAEELSRLATTCLPIDREEVKQRIRDLALGADPAVFASARFID
jgi:hypothetical protein